MISEVKADAKPIVVPMNKAGERAFEVFKAIAERHLKMAREAVGEFIAEHFPNAEKIEEMAMFDRKYNAVYVSYGGVKRSITYDYITKEVYIERS